MLNNAFDRVSKDDVFNASESPHLFFQKSLTGVERLMAGSNL
jgi:hypothetical protein